MKKFVKYFISVLLIFSSFFIVAGCDDFSFGDVENYSSAVSELNSKLEMGRSINTSVTPEYDYSGSYEAILTARGAAFKDKINDNTKELLKAVKVDIDTLTAYVDADAKFEKSSDYTDTNLNYIASVVENTTPVVYVVLDEPLKTFLHYVVNSKSGYSISDDGKIVVAEDEDLYKLFLDSDGKMECSFKEYKANEDNTIIYGEKNAGTEKETRGILIKK